MVMMKKLATFIVKYRKIILLLFIAMMAFCVWGMGQVEIEYNITSYLPKTTDTKRALDIMEEEFTTYGTATVMVRNVTFADAQILHDRIEELDGVKSFEFNSTEKYYKNSCALFNITFEGNDEHPESRAAYEQTLEILKDHDALISVPLIDSMADDLKRDIGFVLILAIVIIVVVLTFTSKSFAEVAVFLIVFGVAALLNMGTNFFLGKISFISNSVCVILQLALAIDYAIILCHRFTEEYDLNNGNSYDAVVSALSKAIPEICGSSLTTIAGLLALTTMALKLGADLGIVLAKSIVCSMITVFFFMPGVIKLFEKPIKKTRHRNFVPSIKPLARMIVKLRYVILVVFVVAVGVGTYFSFNTEYCYSMLSIDTERPSDTQIAVEEIEKVFGTTNQFVLLVPGKDYADQLKIIEMVESREEIDSSLGIANVEINLNSQKIYLTEQINYRKFAELLGVDEGVSDKIFAAYAFESREGRDGLEQLAIYQANKEGYTASLLEICDCVFEHDELVSAILSTKLPNVIENYETLRDTVKDAEAQLIGVNYSRILFNLNADVESPETFALIDSMLSEIKGYNPNVIFAGDSMSAYDLNHSFSGDNLKVSIFTILFVFVILMFTLKSWGMPIPLVLTIQGAIFINFSFFALTATNVFFFVYLIVSAIQMGATIDYAIVTTGRYTENRKFMDSKDAMVEAVNSAFPTIITSGTIMVAASFLIGGLVANPLIATLGNCLGRGVVISILGVLLVIPSLLTVFDKILMKTAFKPDRPKLLRRRRFRLAVINNGAEENHVQNETSGSEENTNNEKNDK